MQSTIFLFDSSVLLSNDHNRSNIDFRQIPAPNCMHAHFRISYILFCSAIWVTNILYSLFSLVFSIQSGGCILLSQFVLEQLKVVFSSGRYRESSTQGSPDNKTAFGIAKGAIITDCHIIRWSSITWRSHKAIVIFSGEHIL